MALQNTTATLSSLDNGDTTTGRIKLADIAITDDALGSNTVTLTGADTASFEVAGTSLYLKAGVALDRVSKASYAFTVSVADMTVADSTAVSTDFVLAVTDANAVAMRNAAIDRLRVWNMSPMSPSFNLDWSNGNYADWVSYLRKDIDLATYQSRRTTAIAGASWKSSYYPLDVYTLAASPTQPVDWAQTGGSSYWGAAFLGALTARYGALRDARDMDRYLEVLADMAAHERTAVATLTSAQRSAMGVELAGSAQGLLNVSTFLLNVVWSFGTFAKSLDKATVTTWDASGWGDASFGAKTLLTDVSAQNKINADQLLEIAQGLFTSYADTLLQYYSTSNYLPNQRFQGLSALLQLAYLFDDVTQLKAYQERINLAVETWLDQVIYPDGGLLEPSFNYNVDTVATLSSVTRIDIDAALKTRIVQAVSDFDLMMDALKSPFGTAPQVGNNRWVSNAGVAPAEQFTEDSMLFPYSGYAVQRDGWGTNDSYLFMYDKRSFRGHSTAGGDSIQMAADGHMLLVSGGTPNYSANAVIYPKSIAYLAEDSSYKTNTIVVDGYSQRNSVAMQVSETYDAVKDTRWLNTDTLDYMESNWSLGYGKFNQVSDVTHQRKVVFLQDMQTWIVVDVMQANAQHEYTQIWKLAMPELTNGVQTQGFYKDQVTTDASQHVITAADGLSPNSVNLSIRQFGAALSYQKYWGGDGGDYGYVGVGTSGEPSFGVDVQAKFNGSTLAGHLGDTVVISVLRPFVAQSGANDGLIAIDRSTNGIASVDLTFANGRSVSVSAATELTTLTAGGLSLSSIDLLLVESGPAMGTSYLVTGDAAQKNASYQYADGVITPLVVPTSFAWEQTSSGAYQAVLTG